MKNTKLIIGAAVALIIGAGAYFYINKHLPQDTNDSAATAKESKENAETAGNGENDLTELGSRGADAYPARKQGEVFLDSISKCSGVQSLGAGIYYKVIEEGSGDKPTAASTVTVNYEGRLVDGTVFDSSYERKMPATFPVDNVIDGWKYILKAMPVGSTWEAYIPWYYAYKESGTQGIPPYSTLIFKIELLDSAQ